MLRQIFHQDIPVDIPSDIQSLAVELNVKKQKSFVICISKPPLHNNVYFFSNLKRFIDGYDKIFKNITIIADFNLEATETAVDFLKAQREFYNLIKLGTCFKSIKGTCIGLVPNLSLHHLIYSILK